MNAADIIARLAAIRQRRLPIGYDLEGSTFVSCQAFAESPSRCFVVVTDQLGEHSAAVWGAIVAVLEDPLVPKWTWNAHHELAVLKLAHGITLRSWEDGMALWFERWPELPKGLKYAASILTRQPCWTEGIAFDADDESGNITGRGVDFYRYNATDAARTLELALHPQIAPTPAASARYALRKRLIEALTWAALKGIRYDRNAADRLRARLTPLMWSAQAEVDRLAGVTLPATPDALLAAAAKRWCHAVKLRKFVLPCSEVEKLATSARDSVGAPDAAPETKRVAPDEIAGAEQGPRSPAGSNPALATYLPGATDPPVGSGVSSPFSAEAPGAPLPAPAPGAAASSPVSDAGAGAGHPVKRTRKPKIAAPPEPLTWKIASDIAKLGGADALTAIQRAFERGPDGAGELASLLDLGVNVKSTKQVVTLLDALKLPKVFRRGERGDESARTKDADVLLDLYLRTSHPVTVALLKCIALRTQLQELDRQLDADGRIRCSFTSCGTETDRTTSHKWLTGSGGNLQTVPRDPVNFRVCYCPDLDAAPGDEPFIDP